VITEILLDYLWGDTGCVILRINHAVSAKITVVPAEAIEFTVLYFAVAAENLIGKK
jgi:hypothetical protein